MTSEEFKSGILKECKNMRAEMESAGRKGDRDITKYTEFTTFSQEEIDSYLGLILANGVNMKPQINLWFLRTNDSTIYGDDNCSKLFTRGRFRRDDFKFFFCMYDTHRTKYLFEVCRMLQHLQINFELYWDTAHDFSTYEQTIGFQGRHNDKIWITFKDAGDAF